MKTINVYQKNVPVIKGILIFLLVLFIPLIIGFTYNHFKSNYNNTSAIHLVMNENQEFLFTDEDLLNGEKEYHFSVIGNNDTLKDIKYNIEALPINFEGINENNLIISLEGEGVGALSNYGPITPTGLMGSGLSFGEGTIEAKANVVHNYTVRVSLNEEILADIEEAPDQSYAINIKINY